MILICNGQRNILAPKTCTTLTSVVEVDGLRRVRFEPCGPHVIRDLPLWTGLPRVVCKHAAVRADSAVVS